MLPPVWLTVHITTFMGADKSESLGLMDYPVSSPLIIIYPSFYVATEHILHFPEEQCNKGNGIYPVQLRIFISSKSACLKQFRWTKSSSAYSSPMSRGSLWWLAELQPSEFRKMNSSPPVQGHQSSLKRHFNAHLRFTFCVLEYLRNKVMK